MVASLGWSELKLVGSLAEASMSLVQLSHSLYLNTYDPHILTIMNCFPAYKEAKGQGDGVEDCLKFYSVHIFWSAR